MPTLPAARPACECSRRAGQAQNLLCCLRSRAFPRKNGFQASRIDAKVAIQMRLPHPLLLASFGVLVAAASCTLITDVDRSKIPDGTTAGAPSSSGGDGSVTPSGGSSGSGGTSGTGGAPANPGGAGGAESPQGGADAGQGGAGGDGAAGTADAGATAVANAGSGGV